MPKPLPTPADLKARMVALTEVIRHTSDPVEVEVLRLEQDDLLEQLGRAAA